MLKHLLLTSKKSAVTFSIVYLITRVLYLITPLTVTYLIQCVENKDSNCFAYTAVFYFVLFFVTQIMDYYTDITEEKCYADSYVNLVRLISHKISFRNYRNSDLSLEEINQLTGQEFEKANKYFFVEIIRLIYYVLSVLFILWMLFVNSWKIAIVILVLLMIFIPLNLKMGKDIDEKSEKTLNSMTRLRSILNDQYVISKEDHFLENKQIDESSYDTYVENFAKDINEKIKSVSFYLNIISYGSLNMLITVMLILVCYFALKGEIRFSTIYLFNSYTSQLWSPGEFIFGFRSKYKECTPIFNKIKRIENIEETESSSEVIENIAFVNYVGTAQGDKPLHKQITVTLSKNNIYLIKGENGSGKTTMIENLLGFSNRYRGCIKINGKTDLTTNDFLYIPSKPFISFFYDEKLSKGSDGQKKKHQISKALKEDKTVIIMDEPTNFLDASTKQKFIQFLNELKNNHILIIVTHDPIFDGINTKIIHLI